VFAFAQATRGFLQRNVLWRCRKNRLGCYLWSGWPLSTANADTFKANVGAELAKLESKGVALAGFELGNEFNWTGFNADFPLPAQGRVLDEKDLVSDPEGQKIAQGYLRYIETLAALKDIRDHSTLNQRTPIISGGLADLDDSGKWLSTVKADAVSVDATLHFLLDRWSMAMACTSIPWRSIRAQRRARPPFARISNSTA
jgi:hypothetical protein